MLDWTKYLTGIEMWTSSEQQSQPDFPSGILFDPIYVILASIKWLRLTWEPRNLRNKTANQWLNDHESIFNANEALSADFGRLYQNKQRFGWKYIV